MTYKYLFGPVPSRRLGVSLGVDLIPHKVCSLNCVYCECGETNNLTIERREYVSYEGVIRELDHFLANNSAPDYITFSGYGEPTLHNRIGDVITHIKESYPTIPTAVLTNGTLFTDSLVRAELLSADLVLPSLDGATDAAFSIINRPHQELNADGHIQGLIDFRQEFDGEMWLEIFILPGMNDDIENLAKLKDAARRIKAERTQLNTLDRPGAVMGLKPASAEFLDGLLRTWNLDGLEIIADVSSRKEAGSFRDDIEEAIFETIARRPCTLDDLNRILDLHGNETNKYLATLEAQARIETVNMERGLFYQARR